MNRRASAVAGRALLTGAALLVLSLILWKFRIFDSGVNPRIEVGPVDIYIEVTPMNAYGFGALRAGHVPLWNPYQFCGEPFLAMVYVGLLYPPHLINVVFDVLTSLEISFVCHTFLASVGMWCLARHFGIGILGALGAVVTFTWSGWLVQSNYLPATHEAMTWMPLVVLLIDKVLEGASYVWVGLIAALACQVLAGAVEPVVHTVYVGGLVVVWRLVQMGRRGEWLPALGRIGLLVLCGVAAILLATPQLLPAIELTRQTPRAPGSLTLAQVLYPGTIPAGIFLPGALEAVGMVTVGFLPLLAMPLVIGFRRNQLAWVVGLIAAVMAALLVFGEPVYRYYYAVPVLGSMFRRPMKFLDIYAFGQALLVGVALTRLEDWADVPRSKLWRQPNWLAALVAGLAALGWLVANGKRSWHVAGALALLLLYWALPRRAPRRAVLVGLFVLQAATLFLSVGNTYVRPLKRPEIFRRHDALLESLKRDLGDARVYLSPKFWFDPDLTAKQGVLSNLPVVIDYEPLAVARYERFFTTITPPTAAARLAGSPFAGAYDLTPTSRWRLMDLTGTKYFVMFRGEPGDVFMSQQTSEFSQVYAKDFVHAYERKPVLPRAYFVTRARVLPNSEAVLASMDSPDFDPRTEVLFEEPVAATTNHTAERAPSSMVKITAYEPERVVVAADVKSSGFLVLADLFYPGWKAFIGDREVPIERANYLFRAVHLDPGSWDVRFEFRPMSFRIGLWLSGATALAIVLAVVMVAARRRVREAVRG